MHHRLRPRRHLDQAAPRGRAVGGKIQALLESFCGGNEQRMHEESLH